MFRHTTARVGYGVGTCAHASFVQRALTTIALLDTRLAVVGVDLAGIRTMNHAVARVGAAEDAVRVCATELTTNRWTTLCGWWHRRRVGCGWQGKCAAHQAIAKLKSVDFADQALEQRRLFVDVVDQPISRLVSLAIDERGERYADEQA